MMRAWRLCMDVRPDEPRGIEVAQLLSHTIVCFAPFTSFILPTAVYRDSARGLMGHGYVGHVDPNATTEGKTGPRLPTSFDCGSQLGVFLSC